MKSRTRAVRFVQAGEKSACDLDALQGASEHATNWRLAE